MAVAANLMAADDFDSGLATCSDLPSCSEIVCPVKRLPPPTLKQHYYPEGGWGWFIVLIAVVVQTLNHGVQIAAGALLPLILKRFPTATYKSAGKIRRRPLVLGLFDITSTKSLLGFEKKSRHSTHNLTENVIFAYPRTYPLVNLMEGPWPMFFIRRLLNMNSFH